MSDPTSPQPADETAPAASAPPVPPYASSGADAPAPQAAPGAYPPPAYPAPASNPPAYQNPPAYPSAPAYQNAPAYGSAPAYPAPPAYAGAPAYGQAYGAAAPRTNSLAIVSLVAGIAAFVILPLIASIVAVITGHMSLKQLKTSGENGRGMALTGTILGWVGVGLGLIFGIALIFWFVAVFGALATSGYTSS